MASAGAATKGGLLLEDVGIFLAEVPVKSVVENSHFGALGILMLELLKNIDSRIEGSSGLTCIVDSRFCREIPKDLCEIAESCSRLKANEIVGSNYSLRLTGPFAERD